MISQQIRKNFLAFFKKNGHALVPSSSVIPHDDPSLLFINAGMNQFKDVFLGKTSRDYHRATSSQKCIRVGGKHNDLENVGHTARHLTFFEMLGNFSFGDYFKKEAIEFAWTVSLEVFGFDPQFIWASVFHEDEEAFELWRSYLPAERIVRMGEKDNFWAMGDTGPCGPCSELYFDKGIKYGKGRSPAEDVHGERFLEFWNLVFMQFNKDVSGQLLPLPKKSVDTGAGLERVVSLIMGVNSVFETDVLRSLITSIEDISKIPYHGEPAFHVIADHIRTLAFAIADGVQPSNLDRGYVLRKVLRRAVRYGRQLNLDRPFLAQLLPTLIHHMGEDFQELKTAAPLVAEVLTREEEAFLRTLKRGGNILNQVIANSTDSKIISGQDAFKLKDTYGLPLEEILLLAKDAHLGVDIACFEDLELQAKERSRGARKVTEQIASTSVYEEFLHKHGKTHFVGHDSLTTEATILGLVKNGQFVEALHCGEEGIVLLNRTSFYAEMGGQVGDQGILSKHTSLFEVIDTQSPYSHITAHIGVVREGELRVSDVMTATVHAERRARIAHHHTATHLLHWALAQVLGPHVKQAGSIVEAERLRFDFHHPKPVTPQEMEAVERLVNEKIRANDPVRIYEISYTEAQNRQDIRQIFGEKYGNTVRVVDLNYSKELCGGTHAVSSGNLGYFRIIKEASVSAGVRRIEAVTGRAAELFVKDQEQMLESVMTMLKVQPSQLVERIEKLLEEQRSLQHKLDKAQHQALHTYAQQLLETLNCEHGVPLLFAQTSLNPAELKQLADLILEKTPSIVLFLISDVEGKCQFLARVSSDLVKKGISAAEMVSTINPILGGKGGGKADFAQGGGTHVEHIGEALKQLRSWILSKRS
ncbi:MAG: alanine--tRNA ligase [Verrucomicrobia bacterium]|nr:alanine--tRNA ligase [Verrucomicrobiota bacterium]MBS0645117.1 alanine--tRNA ligase [Verrucomicrobiota bacterium]